MWLTSPAKGSRFFARGESDVPIKGHEELLHSPHAPVAATADNFGVLGEFYVGVISGAKGVFYEKFAAVNE